MSSGSGFSQLGRFSSRPGPDRGPRLQRTNTWFDEPGPPMDPASAVDPYFYNLGRQNSSPSVMCPRRVQQAVEDRRNEQRTERTDLAPSFGERTGLPQSTTCRNRQAATATATATAGTGSCSQGSDETFAHPEKVLAPTPEEALQHVIDAQVGKGGEEQGLGNLPQTISDEDKKEVERIMDRLVSGKTKGWRMRFMRFTASWFSVTMGTGIINTLLFIMPWHSTHKAFAIMGLCFLILNVILFLGCSIMTTLRYLYYPEVFMLVMRHEVHSMFLGTIPMGFVTTVAGIALQGDYWNVRGPVIEVATGLWWLAVAMTLFVSFSVPFMMITQQKLQTEGLTAAWLLPVVPGNTVASAGQALANLLQARGHFEHAFAVVITSYVLAGMSLLLSILLLAIYLQRLVLHKLPGRDVIVTTFLPLGPCGQGGYALLKLGEVASTLFPEIAQRSGDGEGRKALEFLGSGMYATGLVWGLILWGFGIWWLAMALASVSTTFVGKSVFFNLGWWGFTFPVGSLALLTFALGETLSTDVFRILGTILTACVVILWIVVFIPTLHGCIQGSLFSSPCIASLPPSVVLRCIRTGKIRKVDIEA